MARFVTTGRPPILASLCLLGAVVSLAPGPRSHPMPDELGPPRPCVVAGEPHGDLYLPPMIDRAMIHRPPPIDPRIFLHVPIEELGFDDVVSGFLGLLTGPPPRKA